MMNLHDNVPFNPKENNKHSNRIIDSKQEFSLLEKKMIYCIINQLDANIDIQKDLFKNMYFNIPVNTFGTDYSFKTIKSAIKKITTRSITGGDDKKEKFWSITPIPFAKVENGILRLTLLDEAVPYFIDLKRKGYTSYQLDIALSLTSVYSQRLYELLSRFKDTGKWYVEIERLKFLLGIDKNKSFNGRTTNGKIKEKIIEPAMKELAEKTEISFDYCFEKTGRKYTAITFNIYTKKLIQHIATVDAKQDAAYVLEQLAEASKGEQMVYIHTALARYEFNDGQKKSILEKQPVLLKFIEIHGQIESGAIVVETTRTRLMAWHLRQLGLK